MTKQAEIIAVLGTSPIFNVQTEILKRVDFLKQYMKHINDTSPKHGEAARLVLGISGGVDSLTCGLLAQRAAFELRDELQSSRFEFFAVRLPHGTQADEADAQLALDFIKPDRRFTVDIKPAVVGLSGAMATAPNDFVGGNNKARMRMIAQYSIAGSYTNAIVLGTDHAAEAVSGFFTKHGDGACDIAPLFGLTKGQVRKIAEELGAPEKLWNKVATADLEDDRPQLSDEEALGVTYDQIDAYLLGEEIDPDAAKIIEDRYDATMHKRQPPVTITDTWWK